MKPELLDKIRGMTDQEVYSAIYIDPLTGINNRRAFDETSYSSVVIIDLDSLKYINDNLGHREGDQYLIILAHLLKKHFGSDFVYRLSGDEFAVTSHLKFYQLSIVIRVLLDMCEDEFPGFSFGVGTDLIHADEHLRMNKQLRLECGQRAVRGECPIWLKNNVK